MRKGFKIAGIIMCIFAATVMFVGMKKTVNAAAQITVGNTTYGADQVYDCQRSPAFPNGSDIRLSGFNRPFRGDGSGQEDLEDTYLKLERVEDNGEYAQFVLVQFQRDGTRVGDFSRAGSLWYLDSASNTYLFDAGFGYFLSGIQNPADPSNFSGSTATGQVKAVEVADSVRQEIDQAVESVKTSIAAIGEVKYTDDCKAKIDSARAAYDALTDVQKAQVDNYATLTAAEAKYDELKAAAEEEAKKEEEEKKEEETVPAEEEAAPAEETAKVTYKEVAVTAGEVKDITGSKEATAESNPYNVTIANKDEVATLFNVTDEEKAQGVNVWVEVNDISSTVSDDDKAAVNGALADNSVGLYLDLTLYKKVGNADPVKVTQTQGKVKISIVIPESLRKEGRTFEIIRVHAGVATVITGTYDASTGVYTFETELFSTYVLAYKDRVAEQPASNTSTSTDTSSAAPAATTTSDGLPKTGDHSGMLIWLCMLLASMGVLGVTGYRLYKR